MFWRGANPVMIYGSESLFTRHDTNVPSKGAIERHSPVRRPRSTTLDTREYTAGEGRWRVHGWKDRTEFCPNRTLADCGKRFIPGLSPELHGVRHFRSRSEWRSLIPK